MREDKQGDERRVGVEEIEEEEETRGREIRGGGRIEGRVR